MLPRSRRESFYRPELDALRFTAFLLVFFCHYPHYPDNRYLTLLLGMGRTGVLLFFVLSAYLITELLLREREATGRVHISLFFLRRVLRIWPLYFLAIALGYLVNPLFPATPLSPHALPYLMLLAGNLFVAQHGWMLGLIGPLWSLSIEEQFYLVIPSVVRSFGITGLRNVALLAIALAYAALAWLGHQPISSIDLPWINSFVQFQFFATGTLIAIVLHRRPWSPCWTMRSSLLLGGFILFYLVDLVLHPSAPGTTALQLSAGYLGLLAGSLAIFLAFLRAPVHPPAALVYLGKISFGLYVFHYFTINFAVLGYQRLQRTGIHLPFLLLEPLILLATIGVAALSYHFFERPLLRLKERFAYIKTTPRTLPPAEGTADRTFSADAHLR